MQDSNLIDKLALLYIKDRKLLHARSKGKDTWYIPGGKRELGETDEQALIREINEELGVRLKPESLKYVQTFTAQAHGKAEGVMVQITCYTGEFDGAIRPTSEIEEISFLSSNPKEKISATGVLVLDYLKKENLID
jgi:8-oxo-dGTP diphosphatase